METAKTDEVASDRSRPHAELFRCSDIAVICISRQMQP